MKDQDFSSYKLLAIPMMFLLSLEIISCLKEFVANGGPVVCTYMTGIVDEHNLANLGGWPQDLQDIFGINLVEADTLYPFNRNKVRYGEKEHTSLLEVKQAEFRDEYREDFYAHTPAITSHSFEKGKTYFIRGRLEQSFHSDFYGEIIKELRLAPVISVQHEKGVSVQARQSETEDSFFVMNFTEENQVFALINLFGIRSIK
ncbi:beta-galactosidase trimerization domain-containing protein [Carnobacterium iners]|uniref:beta-galactosidase trimerization domain-containing protein n=1 Tax=Carnobacterium iners TaxID=1073423 RepID=UPI0023EC766A|nr:beta-galactosidase trimerization domain-containing protein [Carnobacterium iners]